MYSEQDVTTAGGTDVSFPTENKYLQQFFNGIASIVISTISIYLFSEA